MIKLFIIYFIFFININYQVKHSKILYLSLNIDLNVYVPNLRLNIDLNVSVLNPRLNIDLNVSVPIPHKYNINQYTKTANIL